MPTNSERHNMIARQAIDDMLRSLKNIPDGMHINDVARQISLNHPMSPATIRRYIKECYVDTGVLEVNDGQLTFKQKW